jgi:hypothetical protein
MTLILFRIIRNNITISADNKGERLDMRKLILIIVFAAFYIFVPFVYVNCSGQDLPYIMGDEPEFSENELYEQCLELDVLISSCVDVLQQYEEERQEQESLVASVSETLDSFEICQVEENIASLTKMIKHQETEDDEVVDTEEAATDSVDCSTVIADMVMAYQICTDLDNSDKFDDCYDVENTVDHAADLCDAEVDTITEDFCSSLTA